MSGKSGLVRSANRDLKEYIKKHNVFIITLLYDIMDKTVFELRLHDYATVALSTMPYRLVTACYMF